jgi:PncC family amidohydrolase
METKEIELAVKVKELFIKRGMSLCLAESVTGGLIASTLTSPPGASAYFHSSVVSYRPEAKELFLGLSFELKENLVSKETAMAMAESIRQKTSTTLSLAITGNAGPDTLEDKPVGLIHMAINRNDGTFTRKMELNGDRNMIRHQAMIKALEFILLEAAK